jgi:hypothetical protein
MEKIANKPKANPGLSLVVLNKTKMMKLNIKKEKRKSLFLWVG